MPATGAWIRKNPSARASSFAVMNLMVLPNGDICSKN